MRTVLCRSNPRRSAPEPRPGGTSLGVKILDPAGTRALGCSPLCRSRLALSKDRLSSIFGAACNPGTEVLHRHTERLHQRLDLLDGLLSLDLSQTSRLGFQRCDLRTDRRNRELGHGVEFRNGRGLEFSSTRPVASLLASVAAYTPVFVRGVFTRCGNGVRRTYTLSVMRGEDVWIP